MKIFAFSGKAGSGKDTTAAFAAEYITEHGFSVLTIHYADLLKYICKTYFGWNGEKDEAGRQLLQTVGTDKIRKHDPDFWVRFVAELLSVFGNAYWNYVLIPDLRFPNELWVLRDCGFDVTHVRLDRGNFGNALTEEQRAHASETALDNETPDYILYNRHGLGELRDGIRKILEEETQ